TQLSTDGQVLTSGGRVLCVTALGDSVSAAQQRAYEAVAKIHWADEYHRTDIGHRAIAREKQH
ncbi:MAG TPA: phosphoribosylamine--glycine ligase, partial [Piscirickettsiaceae bacterium]|nr:phosphoribosylamine--glycine ligase [Piscirickettsiaceae bacterium]